jgi:hypothetical protein
MTLSIHSKHFVSSMMMDAVEETATAAVAAAAEDGETNNDPRRSRGAAELRRSRLLCSSSSCRRVARLSSYSDTMNNSNSNNNNPRDKSLNDTENECHREDRSKEQRWASRVKLPEHIGPYLNEIDSGGAHKEEQEQEKETRNDETTCVAAVEEENPEGRDPDTKQTEAQSVASSSSTGKQSSLVVVVVDQDLEKIDSLQTAATEAAPPSEVLHQQRVLQQQDHHRVLEAELIVKLVTVDLASNDSATVLMALKKLEALCHRRGGGGGGGGSTAAAAAAAELNRTAIYEAGGHIAIVGAMKRWTSVLSAAIQARGCRALANLVAGDAGCAIRGPAVFEAGAVQQVVAAMKNHVDDEYVQRRGCGALRNLCCTPQTAGTLLVLSEQDDNDKSNGLDVVVAAMKHFPNNVLLNQWACDLLDRMSKFEQLQQPMMAVANLLEVLQSVVETFGGNSNKSRSEVGEKGKIAAAQAERTIHRLLLET